MPRPAGRRWARLRRSGSRATQMIARVAGRRSAASDLSGFGTGHMVAPPTDRSWRRVTTDRPGDVDTLDPRSLSGDMAAVNAVAPVSPAVAPTGRLVPGHQVGPATIPLLPGERTPARRVKFAIVNGCTVASLLLGLVAVYFALASDLRLAAIALLGCVVLDGCDGGLARRFGVASPFGAQMDSLADLSSFGVATAIVVYHWLVAEGASPASAAPACALIAVCAAIRLARFNVSPKDGRFFSGVPTTMAAAVLALGILIGPDLQPLVLVAAVAVYAVAMVTSFPYAKLAGVLRLPLWLAVVPAICAMISVSATFGLVVGAYLISGPLLWFLLRRDLTPHRSRA